MMSLSNQNTTPPYPAPCAGARDERCHPTRGKCACFDYPIKNYPGVPYELRNHEALD